MLRGEHFQQQVLPRRVAVPVLDQVHQAEGDALGVAETAGKGGQSRGRARLADHDAAGGGEAQVKDAAPGQARIAFLAGMQGPGGQLDGGGQAHQRHGRGRHVPALPFFPQGGQDGRLGKVAHRHGAGEGADGAVSLPVVVDGEGGTEGQGLGPVQQGLGQLGHGEEKVGQGRGVLPAGDGKAVRIGDLRPATGKGD